MGCFPQDASFHCWKKAALPAPPGKRTFGLSKVPMALKFNRPIGRQFVRRLKTRHPVHHGRQVENIREWKIVTIAPSLNDASCCGMMVKVTGTGHAPAILR